MSTRDAATALRRFGLGPRPYEIKTVAADPRGFVMQSLARPDIATLNDPDLDPSYVSLTGAQVAGQQQKLAREMRSADAMEIAQRRAEATGKMQTGRAPKGADVNPGQMADQEMAATESAKGKAITGPEVKRGRLIREAFQDEASARFEHQANTNSAFAERLVMFWSNHFCVSATKGNVRAIAGGFEREAIRPHVLGKFGDMLKAVEQHPAMLIYLDNQLSFGPTSQAGRNQKKGLNENLAREILELHTLGVSGGYAQDDVTNLARIITGWTIGNLNQPNEVVGKFFYHPQRHEPGDWTVLGKVYKDQGRATGESVLADLARHPSTAKFIARKFAAHFVSENPPPALLQRLEAAFRNSDGDLKALAQVLITSDDAWAAPPRKMLPPTDLVVALTRGFAHRPKAQEMLRLANALGQPLWQVPSPKGWPDDDQAWAGPSALRERLRIAEQVARQLDKTSDPRLVADAIFADTLSEPTRQAIARAETKEQGFELLIMSPEFLRR
jgi:uncharacterized protein (DUF1800 family)